MTSERVIAMIMMLVAVVVLQPVDASEPVSVAAFHPDGVLDSSTGYEDVAVNSFQQPAGAWFNCCLANSWRVTADALFLTRHDPASAALFMDETDNSEVLNADDFHLGVHAGFDVSLTRWMGDRFALECRYFGIDHWNASVNVPTTPGTLLYSVSASPPVTVPAGTAIAASLSSELHNFELNSRYRWNDQWTLLAGFRYVELDERFAADLVDPPIPFSLQTVARNRLYGGQMGADVLVWDGGGRFTADAFGKAGIFGNAAANRSSYSTGIITQTAIGDRTPVAFLGELGIRGRYHFSQRWSAQAGYGLLWIHQIALATEQVAASDFVFEEGIAASGNTFYHGATVGIQHTR